MTNRLTVTAYLVIIGAAILGATFAPTDIFVAEQPPQRTVRAVRLYGPTIPPWCWPEYGPPAPGASMGLIIPPGLASYKGLNCENF